MGLGDMVVVMAVMAVVGVGVGVDVDVVGVVVVGAVAVAVAVVVVVAAAPAKVDSKSFECGPNQPILVSHVRLDHQSSAFEKSCLICLSPIHWH